MAEKYSTIKKALLEYGMKTSFDEATEVFNGEMGTRIVTFVFYDTNGQSYQTKPKDDDYVEGVTLTFNNQIDNYNDEVIYRMLSEVSEKYRLIVMIHKSVVQKYNESMVLNLGFTPELSNIGEVEGYIKYTKEGSTPCLKASELYANIPWLKDYENALVDNGDREFGSELDGTYNELANRKLNTNIYLKDIIFLEMYLRTVLRKYRGDNVTYDGIFDDKVEELTKGVEYLSNIKKENIIIL